MHSVMPSKHTSCQRLRLTKVLERRRQCLYCLGMGEVLAKRGHCHDVMIIYMIVWNQRSIAYMSDTLNVYWVRILSEFGASQPWHWEQLIAKLLGNIGLTRPKWSLFLRQFWFAGKKNKKLRKTSARAEDAKRWKMCTSTQTTQEFLSFSLFQKKKVFWDRRRNKKCMAVMDSHSFNAEFAVPFKMNFCNLSHELATQRRFCKQQYQQCKIKF